MDRVERATSAVPDDFEDSLQRGFRYALSLTHDSSQAEDLVQDAVTTMLGKGVAWDRPYLFATIRNRFIDSYRRKQRIQFISLEGISGFEADPASGDSPDAFDHLEAGHLHEALGSLREDERETLFLAVVEGYTAEEIAQLSGRPRGTVLSMLFRAKGKLREKLSGKRGFSRRGAHVTALPA